MQRVLSFFILALLAASVGLAQDDAAVARPAAEQSLSSEDATTGDSSQASPLGELNWMVGTWVDVGEESTITTTCSWTHGGKFLTRAFEVNLDGELGLKGTQTVGWDPIAKQIRSWTFDSEGGVGEGRWINDGNRWLVKQSFVLGDGRRASAINVITLVDDDTIRWQSTNREVGGELLPNIPEVTVVRQKDETGESPQNDKEESQ